MKTLMAAFAVLMLVSGVASAKCNGSACAELAASPDYIGEHIRLHKGDLENAKDISHCVDAGNIVRSEHINEQAKSRITAMKAKRGNSPIKVVMDESATTCVIGNI